MQLYDITIAPSTTRQLDAPGSYFYYYAGSAGGADSTITLAGLSSGLRIILKPGQAFRLPSGQKETSWIITNYAGIGTIIGSVIVGHGDITDNRVTGSVEIIDGGKQRSITGNAFIVSSLFGTGGAGTLAQVQFVNPAGSAKRIVINKLLVSSGSDATIMLTKGTGVPSGTTAHFEPKSIGSSYTATGYKVDNQTLTVTTGTNIAAILVRANQTQEVILSEPIVIEAGRYFGISNQVTTATMAIFANVIEESAA